MHNINVTPLTDVLLVLLVTFLMTASQLAEAPSSIPLPRVAQAEEIAERTTRLEISRGGEVDWPEAWSGLTDTERLARLRKRAEHPILALAVHQDMEYDRLYPWLRSAREAGWDQVVLLTDRRTDGP